MTLKSINLEQFDAIVRTKILGHLLLRYVDLKVTSMLPNAKIIELIWRELWELVKGKEKYEFQPVVLHLKLFLCCTRRTGWENINSHVSKQD